MARPRAAGYDGQRDLILARAAELFARRGYTATTMAEIAAACGTSKATLYHYVRDKQDLLGQIATGHVARLEALAAEVGADARSRGLGPQECLRALVEAFMRAYARAAHEHRVLTEDVKFLEAAERDAVLAAERRVVRAFADTLGALRPELRDAALEAPVAMLLFGMMNWTFTWLRPGGALTHAALAPFVADLFLGGLLTAALPQTARPADAASRAPRSGSPGPATSAPAPRLPAAVDAALDRAAAGEAAPPPAPDPRR